MTLPLGITGSLGPAFASACHIRLAVKLAYGHAHTARFPYALSQP